MEIKKGEVYVKNNFLPVPLIKEIKTYGTENKPSGINLTEWDPKVVGMSGTIILYSLPAELSSKIMLCVNKLIPKTINLIPDITYTLGGRYSYIPWHNDGNHEAAITIYMNDYWDREWAGAFIYKDGDEYKAIYPEYNKAVFFKSPLDHCTTMPNIQAPLRESLQIFLDRPE
jgi:hypothetical protein